ncbi:hypothetical protein OH76DRAFT_18559 [Lentinus brumalis]|uniref:Uncharacterized protein n=1 Tax=Lentinus brumalis TaxID=2498619 RepID=A0A371DX71_9APHY|nr:hypothetical protein OH76DRAFT_18559 [Polyporus brumalis]
MPRRSLRSQGPSAAYGERDRKDLGCKGREREGASQVILSEASLMSSQHNKPKAPRLLSALQPACRLLLLYHHRDSRPPLRRPHRPASAPARAETGSKRPIALHLVISATADHRNGWASYRGTRTQRCKCALYRRARSSGVCTPNPLTFRRPVSRVGKYSVSQ